MSDYFKDEHGDIRCDCDEGILQKSKLKVHDYKKRDPSEELYSCLRCGRCFLVLEDINTKRPYRDLYDYRAFLPDPPDNACDLAKIYALTFQEEEVKWSAFESACKVAFQFKEDRPYVRPRPKKTNRHQNTLFE